MSSSTTPRVHSMPEATQKLLAQYEGVQVLAQTPQLIALHTIIRDRAASREDFIFYSDRLIRLLVEEGACCGLADVEKKKKGKKKGQLNLTGGLLRRSELAAVREGDGADADRHGV